MLLLHPDPDARRGIQLGLGALGCHVDAAGEAQAAQAAMDGGEYELVFWPAPDVPTKAGSARAVIAVAPRGDRDAAVAALAAGADDCLVWPGDEVDLELCLARIRRRRPRRNRRPPTGDTEVFAGMVGVAPSMRHVFRTIEKVAAHKASVLITGESGTGKELVARAIHDLSPRASKPFVAINCGAIPETLLESELFGYVRGAFTDAVRDKTGLFEQATGGTLFLDEIGELSPALQVKLLRALQEEEIRRVGANATTKIDVRVIAATLRDLAVAIARGSFREDLFYRLNVLPLALPPLRERAEDVPALVEHFLQRYASKHYLAGGCAQAVSATAMKLLCAHPWPGNIRELENTIERALVLCDGEVIEPEMLEDKLRRGHQVPGDPISATLASDELSIKKTTRLIEQELIRRALESTNGNRTNAAKLLEISHRALLYKIKEYGL